MPWLLLTFTLPVKRASQRVEVWRNLQRYGSVPLGNSGYLLPNSPINQERFEWLAQAIRKYAGEASVVSVQSIDNLSTPQLVTRFAEARARDYQELIRELQKRSNVAPAKRASGRLSRLRARFREIVEIDFFSSPLQKRVEDLLADADTPPRPRERGAKVRPKDYGVGRGSRGRARVLIARPRRGSSGNLSTKKLDSYLHKKQMYRLTQFRLTCSKVASDTAVKTARSKRCRGISASRHKSFGDWRNGSRRRFE